MMHTARDLTRNFVDLMLLVFGFGVAVAAITHAPGGLVALVLWIGRGLSRWMGG